MLSKLRALGRPAGAVPIDWPGTARLIVRGLACWVASQELQARAMEILLRDTGLAARLGIVPPDLEQHTPAERPAEQRRAMAEQYEAGHRVGVLDAYECGHLAGAVRAHIEHGLPVPEYVRLDIARRHRAGEWYGPPIDLPGAVDERQVDENDQDDERVS